MSFLVTKGSLKLDISKCKDKILSIRLKAISVLKFPLIFARKSISKETTMKFFVNFSLDIKLHKIKLFSLLTRFFFKTEKI